MLPMHRDVGAPSRAIERDRTIAIAHAHVPLQQEHAKLSVNRSGPKVGAADGHSRVRRRYGDRFLLEFFYASSCEAEGSSGCVDRNFATAFRGIVDIAINCDVGVLAKRQLAVVVEGDFKACIGTGAKPLVHMYRDADN